MGQDRAGQGMIEDDRIGRVKISSDKMGRRMHLVLCSRRMDTMTDGEVVTIEVEVKEAQASSIAK